MITLVGGCPAKKKNFLARANFLEAKIPSSVYLYTSPATNLTREKLEFFKSHTGSLGLTDLKQIEDLAKKSFLTLIGSDLGNNFDAKKALLALVNMTYPLLLEEDALVPELLKIYNPAKHNWLFLLENQDFDRLFSRDKYNQSPQEIAKKYQMTFYYQGKYFSDKEGFFKPLEEITLENPLLSAKIAHQLILKAGGETKLDLKLSQVS